MLNKSIKFLIENKLVAILLLLFFMAWGIVSTPFNLIGIPVSCPAIPLPWMPFRILGKTNRLFSPNGRAVPHRISKIKLRIH